MSKFFNALAVAVLGIALLMGAASAASVTVTGTLSTVTEVTVAHDTVAWALTVGTNEKAGESVALTTNNGAGATVSVAEVASNAGANEADGFMETDGGVELTNALDLIDVAETGTGTPADIAPLTGATQDIYTGIEDETASITYTLSQDVVTGDAAGAYKTVLSFTAVSN
jgi:hypothetical protein